MVRAGAVVSLVKLRLEFVMTVFKVCRTDTVFGPSAAEKTMALVKLLFAQTMSEAAIISPEKESVAPVSQFPVRLMLPVE